MIFMLVILLFVGVHLLLRMYFINLLGCIIEDGKTVKWNIKKMISKVLNIIEEVIDIEEECLNNLKNQKIWNISKNQNSYQMKSKTINKLKNNGKILITMKNNNRNKCIKKNGNNGSNNINNNGKIWIKKKKNYGKKWIKKNGNKWNKKNGKTRKKKI